MPKPCVGFNTTKGNALYWFQFSDPRFVDRNPKQSINGRAAIGSRGFNTDIHGENYRGLKASRSFAGTKNGSSVGPNYVLRHPW